MRFPGGTFDSATGGTFQSDTDGTFHSDIPGTFESDMGGTFKVLQSLPATICISSAAYVTVWQRAARLLLINTNTKKKVRQNCRTSFPITAGSSLS